VQILEDSDIEEEDGKAGKEEGEDGSVEPVFLSRDQYVRQETGPRDSAMPPAGSKNGFDDKENALPDIRSAIPAALDKGCSAALTTTAYKLSAAILHRGMTPYSGHYVASVLCKSQWYLVNDENVETTSQTRVLADVAKEGYVLFFEPNP
jgi:hypothetical protein